MIEFLDRSDIFYTNPERKNNIYVGKFDNEKKFKQKQYLSWSLLEVVSIANSNDEVNQSFDNLTLSQLCNFLESCKEYVYNTDVTHSFCLCQIYENSSLLARGLNKQTKKQKIKEKLPNNQHDLVERFSCNSDEAECMLEKSL